ncbi:GlsB/YeaQ/YmgE family stress response membrane protein [Ruminococcaceae bacterium OttesenSCG-928-I18]|nr:GlsB/YeaQ/YmgE family stress response membrane protein [Ruminococcaceae bacterium OttesenSCG-928-I18]
MGLLSWIIVGALAGWLASKIMNTDKQMGCLTNIIVGIIGAFVGGLIVGLLGGTGVTGFNLWSIFVALLGSVILLWIVKKVSK